IIESGIADWCESWPLTKELEQIGHSAEEYAREVAEHFDHRKKLASYFGATLVLHTAKDQFLPPSHAERLHAWGGGIQKSLVVFPYGDHNQILAANHSEYVREVKNFLHKCGVTDPSLRWNRTSESP